MRDEIGSSGNSDESGALNSCSPELGIYLGLRQERVGEVCHVAEIGGLLARVTRRVACQPLINPGVRVQFLLAP